MDRMRLNLLLRTIGTFATFSLVIYLLSRQGWDEIRTALQAIDFWRFGAAFGLMIISRLAVTARWHILLRSAGMTVTPRQSLQITFSGLFASNFLPTTIGGDVVRLSMLIRMNYDKVIATASLIVDRLIGMAGMATSALLGIAPLLSIAPENGVVYTSQAGFLAGLGNRVSSFLERLWQVLQIWLHAPRALLFAYGWTWIHQFCVFSVVWLMLGGMGETIPLWLTGGLWSFTYFVSLLPFSINGWGLQELSMTAIFTSLGGISVSTAATAALLLRTIQMMASLPGAAFIPDIIRSRHHPLVNDTDG